MSWRTQLRLAMQKVLAATAFVAMKPEIIEYPSPRDSGVLKDYGC